MQISLTSLKRIKKSRQSLKELPEEAGVYVFWNRREPVYIGKAKNLKSRLSSYFNLRLLPKTRSMVAEADSFSFILVNSELESLLLESYLIRKFLPRFNSASRDDKHPLYIRITKEKYPRIMTARKTDLKSSKDTFFGPFPSSTNVRFVLKMLRRIFPFSDHKIAKRPCIESHIGLCNPCPSVIEKMQDEVEKQKLIKIYKQNIRKVKNILKRRISRVIQNLEKQMLKASRTQNYETALELRQKIEKLNYITQPIIPKEMFLTNPDFFEDSRKKEVDELQRLLSPFISIKAQNQVRIECFDVAHLGGTSPTASMVTFFDGVADKTFYRHFKIYQKKPKDDLSSLKEVIKRRLKHLNDWGVPDLIIVDGGKTQAKVFFEELEKSRVPVVGLAKRFETLIIPVRSDSKLIFKELRVPEGPVLNLVQRIRNEAHRFARRLHHKQIKNSLFS